MGRAKYLILLFLGLAAHAFAQEKGVALADTTTKALYEAGDWDRLLDTGKSYLKNGVDFPLLRLRMGYAELMTTNYTAALKQYEKVIDGDQNNQSARYYSYLCDKFLNQDLEAIYQSKFVDSTMLHQANFRMNNISAESSHKDVHTNDRGDGSFHRAGFSVFLFKRLQVDQSLSYFKQEIRVNDLFRGGRWRDDKQTEYFTGLHFALTNKLTLFGGYHYLYTHFIDNFYHSNLGIAGINYSMNYFQFQGEADLGNVTGMHIVQYTGSVSLYPFGNLNLYLTSKASLHRETGNSIFILNETVGVKTIGNLWLELFGVFGDQDNYIDADGLYVYNAYDKTTRKLGGAIYYPLMKHLLLQFSYTYERKETLIQRNYNQYSTTAGLTWKF